ncbi:MAG: cyclic nucleotide-binding protein [Micavibrio aeruginosavorus]|uniref:Cyclic nucleotide-binding protein n=1 Tax=Micavibrio aeruginosavorus TaxID=349221 RepID=A0A2W5N5D9_9BACT|nr:MAG: cyclic nucleotide-binding protein [Micavibrio aeruginosavorus]
MEANQTKKIFKAGDIIMRQGDHGDVAYIIETGRVEILIEKTNGTIHRVGTRGAGTIIGEMAIVDNEPRIATIKAIEDCHLLEITKEDFSRRLKTADPVLQITTQVILTRYRDMLTRATILKEVGTYPTPEELERGYLEQSNTIETVKMANEFRAAIGTEQLSLHYQPIMNLMTGHVDGFEALMRWNHPERGNISPAVFIPIAEDTGLIVDASRWALREACRALKRIESKIGLNGDLFMSVNFSSTDFAEENFLDHLYTIMSETDVEPRCVHLEITERLLMNQPQNAKDTLNLCRKAGLGIAIDDFGTGYSSLSYLHYYPIDTLKIDQSFVRNMLQDKTSMELVKSIIALGKNMNMKIIAEGVEQAEEAQFLLEMGCERAQGYHFSRPLSEKDVTDKLLEWAKLRKVG